MDQSFYKAYAELEQSHWWFLGRWRIFESLLDRYVPSADFDREVLDVGTGTGGSFPRLAAYGEVVGLDSDEGAVDYCIAQGYDNVIRANLPPIPFEADRFSLVTCLDVAEHVEDDQALVDEIRRVAAPGATCLISVPAFQSLWGVQDVVSHHKRRYRRGQVQALMECAGLEILQLSYFNFFLFPAIAAVRLASRVFPGEPTRTSDFDMPGGGGRTNGALAWIFGSEAGLLRHVALPFGVSIVAVGRKPGGRG